MAVVGFTVWAGIDASAMAGADDLWSDDDPCSTITKLFSSMDRCSTGVTSFCRDGISIRCGIRWIVVNSVIVGVAAAVVVGAVYIPSGLNMLVVREGPAVGNVSGFDGNEFCCGWHCCAGWGIVAFVVEVITLSDNGDGRDVAVTAATVGVTADTAAASSWYSGMVPRSTIGRLQVPSSIEVFPLHPSATNASHASKNSLKPARVRGFRLNKTRNKLTHSLDTRTSFGKRTALRCMLRNKSIWFSPLNGGSPDIISNKTVPTLHRSALASYLQHAPLLESIREKKSQGKMVPGVSLTDDVAIFREPYTTDCHIRFPPVTWIASVGRNQNRQSSNKTTRTGNLQFVVDLRHRGYIRDRWIRRVVTVQWVIDFVVLYPGVSVAASIGKISHVLNPASIVESIPPISVDLSVTESNLVHPHRRSIPGPNKSDWPSFVHRAYKRYSDVDRSAISIFPCPNWKWPFWSTFPNFVQSP